MKKTIIIGFVLFFMAVVVQAEDKEVDVIGEQTNLESALKSAGEYPMGPVRVVSYLYDVDGEKELIILFDDGYFVRATGASGHMSAYAAMGSASLAEDININAVYDTYGQFIGIKLQRVD